MVLLCFLTMDTMMVEKQPCCFPKVPAQQSMIRKQGSSPLLPCLAVVPTYRCGQREEVMKVLGRNSLSDTPGAAFHTEPGPALIKDRFFGWIQGKMIFWCH